MMNEDDSERIYKAITEVGIVLTVLSVIFTLLVGVWVASIVFMVALIFLIYAHDTTYNNE